MSNKSGNRVMGFGSMIGLSQVSYGVLPENVTLQLRKEVQPPLDSSEVELAPFLISAIWRPTEEQRKTAKHFGNTEDVFDLLAL